MSEIQKDSLKEVREITLKELLLKFKFWWSYIWSKWLIIFIFSALGGAFGLSYALLKEPIYTASTTFVLEDEKGGGAIGGLAGLASIAGVDVGGGGGIFQGDNILELYKSRTMLEKTLLSQVSINGKKELLADKYVRFKKLRQKWANNQELKSFSFILPNQSTSVSTSNLKSVRLRDSILGEIVTDINKNYLHVGKPDKKLSKMQVDLKSEDEVFAKSFNDELVKNVNEFYIETKTKKALQNVRILQHKTDSVRAVMNGAIYTAVQISDSTPNLNPTRQVQRVAPAQKAQFSAETNKAVLAELVKNLEMSKISLAKETPLIQIVDQPIYPLTKEKISKAKSIIMGGVLFGLLSCFALVIRKIFKLILS